MLTKNDIVQLKKVFVTKEEFNKTIYDLRDTLIEFLIAFRNDFEDFKQEMTDFKQEMTDFKHEMIEFRAEMRDITTYQRTRIDALENKVYS